MPDADDTLTAEELRAVTGKAQAKSQAAALARLGLPFRFTGRSVILERAIARAHELLPRPAGEVPVPQPDQLNAGLRAWQASRNAAQEALAEARRLDPRYSAEAKAADREARAARSRALNAERGRRRKAAERRQMPAWADRERIVAIYEDADRATRETGIQHHVDHVIPLRGKLASGLHVHQNLRVITATENRKKSSRYNP